MRALIDRIDGSRKLLPAVLASDTSPAHGLATERRNAIKRTAEWAVAALRPADSFEVLPGFFKVSENRVRQIYSRGVREQGKGSTAK